MISRTLIHSAAYFHECAAGGARTRAHIPSPARPSAQKCGRERLLEAAAAARCISVSSSRPASCRPCAISASPSPSLPRQLSMAIGHCALLGQVGASPATAAHGRLAKTRSAAKAITMRILAFRGLARLAGRYARYFAGPDIYWRAGFPGSQAAAITPRQKYDYFATTRRATGHSKRARFSRSFDVVFSRRCAGGQSIRPKVRGARYRLFPGLRSFSFSFSSSCCPPSRRLIGSVARQAFTPIIEHGDHLVLPPLSRLPLWSHRLAPRAIRASARATLLLLVRASARTYSCISKRPDRRAATENTTASSPA